MIFLIIFDKIKCAADEQPMEIGQTPYPIKFRDKNVS